MSMIKRYLLVHKEFGIYLGSCLGMGFWSELDPAGQTEACTFESEDAALKYMESWDDQLKVTPIAIATLIPESQLIKDDSCYATQKDIIDSGLSGWAL